MAAAPPRDALLDALHTHFGHADFRAGQRDVVEAIAAGQDAVVVMPTGLGKSLCYQLPAVLGGGTTLVVSPLIALMKDQIDSLRALGIPAAALHSNLDSNEQWMVQNEYREGRLRLLYVAPERLVRPDFRSLLVDVRPSRIVVDEAHCISEWGHDFRRDYLRIGDVASALAPMQVVACTATATPQVRADIAARLRMRDPYVVVQGFARPNLLFSAERLRGEAEKLSRLDALLDPGDGHAIVYAGTRARARDLAERLATRLPTMLYHGDMPADARTRAQERFASGQVRVAVTTSAFGMGVDVPTVRQVIHVALPSSLEEYYQQAGRAGRDGQDAQCIVLYTPADRRLQDFFIEVTHPEPSVLEGVRRSLRDMGGDPGAWNLVVNRDPSVRDLRDPYGDAAREILREHGVVDANGRVVDRDTLPPIDHARINAHRRQAMRRLEALITYLGRPVCRHRQIMEYFGESGAPESCGGRCDVCRPKPTAVRHLDPELVRDVLDLVVRLGGRIGLSRVAAVLCGSRSRSVLDLRGIDDMQGYGMLSGWRGSDAAELLRLMIDAGLLHQTPGPYPTVALTRLGVSVIRGDNVVQVGDPRPDGPMLKPSGKSSVADALSPDDRAVFDMLRRWRLERARAISATTPAYMVLSDRTLAEIVARRPRTDSELRAISGMGENKLALYGADLLGLLAAQGSPASVGET